MKCPNCSGYAKLVGKVFHEHDIYKKWRCQNKDCHSRFFTKQVDAVVKPEEAKHLFPAINMKG